MHRGRPSESWSQLRGPSGCVVDRSEATRGCTPVRALRGPAPFLGSNAVAISPDGKNVYVASSESDAIAIFKRKPKTGKPDPAPGDRGLHLRRRRGGCATAVGLEHPNSVAVSADGANVYATSVGQQRGRDLQPRPVDRRALPGRRRQRLHRQRRDLRLHHRPRARRPGRRHRQPRRQQRLRRRVLRQRRRRLRPRPVDRRAHAAGRRRPAASSTRPPTAAPPRSRSRLPRGWRSAPTATTSTSRPRVSNAVVVLTRDPSTGALTQATDGSGCIVNAPLTGCTTGIQLERRERRRGQPRRRRRLRDLADQQQRDQLQPHRDTGELTQQSGTSACAIYVLAVGCSLGRALSAPEGIAASPDGASVYAAAFDSNAVDVFNRDADSGGLIQKSRPRRLRDHEQDAGLHAALGRWSRSARSPSARTASRSTRGRSEATRSRSSSGSGWGDDPRRATREEPG